MKNNYLAKRSFISIQQNRRGLFPGGSFYFIASKARAFWVLYSWE